MEKDFLGREALERRKTEDRPHIACLLLEDPRSMVLGNEPVFAGDRVVSRVTSGGVGYHVGRSIAFAYLPSDLDPATDLSIDVFGERVPAEIATSPLYDPKAERIRPESPLVQGA